MFALSICNYYLYEQTSLSLSCYGQGEKKWLGLPFPRMDFVSCHKYGIIRLNLIMTFSSRAYLYIDFSRGQSNKKFYGCKLRILLEARVFVPGKPFQSSLMFAGKG
jgi:hypothetical protein